jgi:uncharacterized membrane protein
MIEWILEFTRDLAFIVWLGGLIVIDFVETPAKFRTPEINRNQAVAVGRQVFAAFNRVEVIAGALLLATSVLLARLTGAAPFGLPSLIVLVGLMWVVALAQNFWIRPRMSALSSALDLVNRATEDTRYGELRGLHVVYVALDLSKIALGLIVLALWIINSMR